jgi:spore photoproduct lyase
MPLLEGTSAVIEARTKSADIDCLPGLDGRSGEMARRHLLVTWTLSPEEAIEMEEPGTALIGERLEGISRVSSSGIAFALRLDPIIPEYWDSGSYRELLEKVAEAAETPPRRIELGLLRFPPGLVDAVRADFPFSPILKGEYVRDGEGKLRLYRPLRIGIYRAVAEMIRKIFPGTPIELSQEDSGVWEDAGIEPPGSCLSH